MYFYGAAGTMIALIGASLAEFTARRSIPGVLEGLKNLSSNGITDQQINEAIENLSDTSGSQFFSSDLSEAKSLLESYGDFTGNAVQSMQELDERFFCEVLCERVERGIRAVPVELELLRGGV